MPLGRGQVFAGYTIVRLLGSGGMGEVYLAEHPRLPRPDAIKVLPSDVSVDPEFRERFNREADLAAKLYHPHIVGVHDRGEFDGQLWIAMDYVEGTDAGQLLKANCPNGMPEHDVCAVVTAVASALDYANQRGLLHRDVKPANILLTDPEDGERRVMLADFGIARQIAEVSGLTATNMTVGTVTYAAPEQLMGSVLDGRADQYALAATAFHLLTGTAPYEHSNPVAVISKHLNAPPPKLGDLRQDLTHLNDVLTKGLSKDPKDRFGRCRDFAAELSERVRLKDHQEGDGSDAKVGLTAKAMPSAITQRRSAIHGANRSDDGPGGVASRATVTSKRRTGRYRTIGAACAVALATTAALVVFVVRARDSSAPLGPSAAVLDGVYEVSANFEHQTRNGAPVPVTSSSPSASAAPDVPQQVSQPPPKPWSPQDNVHQRAYWAHRSKCGTSGCVAKGVLLDDQDHSKANTSGTANERRYVDGRWQSKPFVDRGPYDRCSISEGKQVPGSDTESTTSSWLPESDGRLSGLWTQTVITNECGVVGRVTQVPVTVKRIDNVSATLDVPDPAVAADAPSPPQTASPKSGGPSLDGLYRLDYDRTNQKLNGAINPIQTEQETEWWAFHSQCGSLGCVATAAKMDRDNNQVPKGIADVLHFDDGRWDATEQQVLFPTCTVTRNGVTGREQSPQVNITKTWTPEPDGSLHGTETFTVMTDECGQKGRVNEYPFAAVRVGIVPPSVVLADPNLFVS